MKRIDFNAGWYVKKHEELFDGLSDTKQSVQKCLPSDEMIYEERRRDSVNGPDGAWYDGETYTFVKKFTPDSALAEHDIFLEFEGVSANAMVFINNQFAGKCPYAYSSFLINAGKYLDYDQVNEIKVVSKTGMQKFSRWYQGAGIYRPVWMLTGDKAFIIPNGIHVSAEAVDSGVARLCVELSVKQSTAGKRKVVLEISIKAPNGKEVASDNQSLTLFDQTTEIVSSKMDILDPLLWGTNHPNLYSIKVSLIEHGKVLEEQTIHYGVRSLTFDHFNGLRINGEKVKLRGACLHHDNGLLGAVSLKDAEVRKIRKLKQAGFNAIRSAHNPASEYLLEACDEEGMLVMDELFDVWNTAKRDHDYSLYFSEWWDKDLRAMVEKDYNHACVVVYTVGNEITETGTAGGAAMNRKMVRELHRLDSTRPVANCINGMFSVMPHIKEILSELVGDTERVPDDINELMTMFDRNVDEIMKHSIVSESTEETFSGSDICGYNYMASRYEMDGSKYPNRIILGSETNPDKIGYNWPVILKLPYVLGDFCWTGWDYIGEAGVGKNDYEMTHKMYGPWPWFLAYCGDFDILGNRRPQSYYREIVFGLRKEPYICTERPEHYMQEKCVTNWTWPDVIESWSWPGFEHKRTHVEVYSDAEEIELSLNGKILERKKVGEKMPFKAIFDVEYMPGKLEAAAYSGNRLTGRTYLMTTGAPTAIKLLADKKKSFPDGKSLVYIDVTCVDQDGHIVPYAQDEVSIQVTGAMKVVGFGSANPKTTETFHELHHKLFDGRGQIILRSSFESGKTKIHAESGNLLSGNLDIETSGD